MEINFKDTYNAALKGSKKAYDALRCGYTKVSLVEEIKKYPDDAYYLSYLIDTNNLISYPVYLNRQSKEYILSKRREFIEQFAPEINEKLNIPQKFHNVCFSKTPPMPAQKSLFDKALHFCKTDDAYNMLITGAAHGQGKSLVAACVVKEEFINYGVETDTVFIDKLEFLNQSVLFVNEWDIISVIDLLNDTENHGYSLQQVIRRLSDVRLLVIDDMFSVRSFKKKQELLDIYMPVMYNRADVRKLRTVITTNRSLEELNKLSGYIYSRIDKKFIYNCKFTKLNELNNE